MISFLVGTVVVGGLAVLARPTLRLIKKAKIPKTSSMTNGKSIFLEGGFHEEMNKSEAFQILNLDEKATIDEIKNQHKKLMIKNHPDAGGSTYISIKINEAKDLLLGKQN
eukprot:gene10814-3432_t